MADLDFRSPRGLDRSVVLALAGAGWVTRHHNLVVTGPTGVGKSFLACALANAALRQGHTAYYARTPRLLDDLALGRTDGRYARLLNQLGRVSLLVVDDFLPTPPPSRPAGTCSRSSRTGPSAAPPSWPANSVEKWHVAMADPTLAEAVLVRIRRIAQL